MAVGGEVLTLEDWALRRLVAGPGNWIRPVDLQQLKAKFGLPFEFPSFAHMSWSSKLRILEYEPQMNLGMQRCELASVLCESVLDRSSWNTWYNNSYALILFRAKAQLEQIGITSAVVRR